MSLLRDGAARACPQDTSAGVWGGAEDQQSVPSSRHRDCAISPVSYGDLRKVTAHLALIFFSKSGLNASGSRNAFPLLPAPCLPR